MRIYTVEDIIPKYNTLLRYCTKLTNFNIQEAEDLLHDVIYNYILKEPKEFERDYHFLCAIEKACKFKFLENIRKAKLDTVDNDVDYYLDYDLGYDQNFLGDYDNNIDVYYMTKDLSYFEKKMLYNLHNGYTKQELKENYNLHSSYFTKLFSKFNGEVFVNSSKYTNTDNILSKITNDKHKRIYKLYLDRVPLADIVERTNTSYSAVEQTIYRIKKKYGKEKESQSV